MITFCLGRLRVGVRFSFICVVLLMLELSGSDWGLWCVGAALFHELGHLLAFAAVGDPPRAVYLEAGGMRIVPSGKLLPPFKEAVVTAGGSFLSLFAAGVLFGLRAPLAGGVHLLLGLFNLLPLRALDGGRLLSLLLTRLLGFRRGETAARAVGTVTMVFLLIWGLCLLREGNVTLLFTLLCLIPSEFA